MKNWLKRLLCDHIWKIDKSEVAGYGYRYPLGTTAPDYWIEYKVTINYNTCVKCGKTKITEVSLPSRKSIFGQIESV